MAIWRDFHFKRWFVLSFLLVFLIMSINAVRPTLDTLFTKIMILPLVPLLLFFLVLRIKLTYVNSEGIRIGNALNGEYYSIRLNRPKFIKWHEIKQIQIKRKAVKQPLMMDYQSFLNIKTKDGKNYESFLAQPQKFIETLKILGKQNLLGKVEKNEPKWDCN